jgi:diacylglycerol kinase (ATP)
MQKNIAFIINPKSGTDRVKALQQAIQQHLPEPLYKVSYIETQYAGHAKLIARELSTQPIDIVVAVGGDGTVNEVASGLINTNMPMGIVPKGSGNGLARACNIPLLAPQALQVIAKGYIKCIDTGLANNELFVSNAGVGFDAEVAKQCMQLNSRGLLMYIQQSIKTFASYKPLTYTITTHTNTQQVSATMISVANGNEFGYGFKIAPTASLIDGKLDAMIIKPLNLISASTVSFNAWRGNLHKHSKVQHIMLNTINIKCPQLTCHQIDGDYRANNGELDISIQPQSLNIIVP